jgi:hypothetical protein
LVLFLENGVGDLFKGFPSVVDVAGEGYPELLVYGADELRDFLGIRIYERRQRGMPAERFGAAMEPVHKVNDYPTQDVIIWGHRRI